MNDDLHVSATEFRAVRVFALDMTPAEFKAMAPDLLAPLLQTTNFDPTKAEIVERRTLGDLGISGYLRDGYGIPPEALQDDIERLDADGGLFAVIPTSAFQGVAQKLTPRPPLHFVGFYNERPSRPHEVTAPADVAPVPPATPKAAPNAPAPRPGSLLLVGGLAILLLILALMLFL